MPIDFSPSARAALEYATFVAGKFGAELEVLHVWEPPGYVGPDTLALLPVGSGQPGWEQTRTDVTREVEHFLAKATAKPKQLSVRVEAGEDSLTVHGTGAPPAGGATIATALDHRIAMSFLVLGMATEEPVVVDDAAPIETSFPGFVEVMNGVGGRIGERVL